MVERIKHLLAPPVFPEDNNKTRAASVLNTLLLAILALLIFNTLRALLIQFELIAVLMNAINIPIALALMFFLRRGNVRGSSLATVSLFWLAVTIVSLTFTGVDIIILSSYYVLVILAGLLLGRQASQIVVLLSIFASALIFIGGENGWLTPTEGDPLVNLIASLSLLVIITVALNLTLSSLEGALHEREEKQKELERAQSELEERVALRTRDLKLASEGARQLAQIRNLDELLARAVETVQSSFELYYTQLYLLDEAARQLTLRAGTGIVGRRLLNQGHFLPLDMRTINGTAVLERRTILVSDTGQDPLFYPNPLLPDTRSEIAVPLLLGERALGVLNMQSRAPGAFSQENVSVFETLAGQLAVALDNALLLAAQRETAVSLQQALAQTEQQANQLAHLNEMVSALNQARETEAILAIANQHLCPMLSGDQAAIVLLDVSGDAYEWYALEGASGVRLQETGKVGGTAVSHTLRQNQIVQLPRDLAFDQFPDTRQLAQAGMRSSLYIPLVASSQVIGVLIVAHPKNAAYTPTDVDIFRQVANQFASSLDSHRLSERLNRLAAIVESNPDLIAISRLNGEISYLNASGLRLLGLPPETNATQLLAADFVSAEDATTLMEIGLPSALELGSWTSEVQLTQADGATLPARATIIIHEDAASQTESFFLTIRDISERKRTELAQQNLTAQLEERLLQVNSLQRAMTREGWSAFMSAPDRLVQGYAYDGEALRLISRRDLQGGALPMPTPDDDTSAANVAAPIAVRGETIGMLALRTPDGAPLNQTQHNILQTLSHQLAEALERARLFEEIELARSQTDALYAGSEQVIQARSLDAVLRALVENTQLRYFQRVDMVFFDTTWESAPPRLLQVASTWNRQGEFDPDAEKRTFRLGQFPFLKEKHRHTPFVCPNVQTDSRLDERTRDFILKAQGAQSFAVFPLVSGERWIGLVVAQSVTEQRLTEQQVRQISSLVSQAATVSQTQRLFTEAQQRARREQLLREIANRVYAAADAESILRTAAREVNQALGLETFIYLEEVDGSETAVTNGRHSLAGAPEAAPAINAGE